MKDFVRVFVDSIASCFGIKTANMELAEVELYLEHSMNDNYYLFDTCITLTEQLTQASFVSAVLSVILVSVLVAAIFI